MDDTPDVSVESHEHNFKFSVEEKGQKASHSMEDNKLSLVREDFMEEPGHTQNIVCEAGPLGAASVSIVGDSSSKGNESEKDDHVHDHLSADEKALQDMEGNKILCKVMGDDELSNVASADKDLQDHSMEGKTVLCGVMGGNEPINIASVDLCAEAQTLIELSVSVPEGFNIERNVNEKDDHQNSCFVCPSSTEENRFCEVNLEQKRMIAIQVASELGNNMEDSLSNDEWVEGRGPAFEMAMLGEDGETKAGAEDAVLELAANASDEVQDAAENKISDVAGCKGTFSGVVGCEEGKSILGSKDFDIRDSGSLDILMQPKAIQDKDTKNVLPVFNEKQCLVLQELHSEPEDEAPQDAAVGTATHVQKEEGDCPKTADNTQGANDLNTQCATEDVANSSISTSLLNTQDGSKGTEQVCHSSHLLIERGTCESGNENIPAERSLIGPEVASNKLQDTVTQVESEDDSASRSLEVRTCVVEAVEDNASAGDAKSEDATASRIVEVLTCVVDNVVHNASAGDEDCFLAAGLSPSKICSPSSSIRSPPSQVRAMDDYSLNVQCSKDTTNAEVSSEVKSLCQTENGTASSECQLHGYFIDKDGGSSLDSTAGTGWKLQGDGGCVATEDEEVSSTGGEDSASSPACIQPSAHQRKKINIHHQFVREIVKIQHDREQYDREHAERQIQAQQAANLVQLGGKNSDVKEHKSETRQVRSGTSNISSQKGLMDHGADKQAKESQQKHATRNKKSSLIQAKDGSEQGREPLLQGRDSVGAKEHGKTGRGKQQRSMSIYRPPIVRDTLAAVSHEQKNLGELESSYHQSGSYVQNSSPDSSMSSISETRGLSVGSPDLVNDEGTFRVVRSSSGECNTQSMETQADENTPGMGIKVTFDTERKMRHIEFSDGPDLPRGQRQNEQTSLVASGFGVSKSPMINPLLSHPFQDSKSSSLTSLNAGKRHAGIGETLTKGNDRYFTQADRSSWSQPTKSSQSGGRVGKPSNNNVEKKNTFFETLTKGNDRYVTQADRSSLFQPTESSQFRGRVGKPSDNNVEKKNIFSETLTKRNDHYFTQADRSSLLQPTESAQSRGRVGKPSDNNVEKKNTFFEQADNSAILHNSSSWSHKSPSSLVRHGINDGLSGQNIHSNSLRHPDGHTGGMRMPSALLQGFSTPGSHKPPSPGPSYNGELWAPTPFATSHVKSDEPNRTPVNRHASFQSHQLNVSRSQHDTKGKQRVASSTDGSKKKRDSQLRNSIKEAGSPFQAMMKDMNRPQVMFSSPAPQSSVDGSLDFQGLGMSWNTEDRTRARTRNPDSSQESLKRSQSDASRRGSTQNLQAQLSPLPSRENVFCTMPMREKWGDIVDDLSDTYDYLQVKGEGERESRSGSLSYGVHNQNSAVFVDSSLRAEMPMLRDSKQDKAFRKYGYEEIDSLQRNQNLMHYQSKPSELVQEHSAYEIPVRKSVFERLGPRNNFRDSILGPPPKVLDSRGVLKASPDAFVSSVPPVSTYSSIDSGFHGSQQASHLSSTLHDSGDNMIDEGREVVVQAYTEMKQRRSKRELYVPRRGS